MISKQISSQTQFKSNKSQQQLQILYRQLQENIKQRFDALSLQYQINKVQSKKPQSCQNAQTLLYLKQSHAEMQKFYSSNLLNTQVTIQEQQQMRMIIKNYEQKISELRSSLVNKQAEISYELYQKKRHSIIRKQSMTCFNNQIKVQKDIKKAFEQLKRLKVQISAIQHAIQFHQSQNNCKQITQKTSLSVQKCHFDIQNVQVKEKIDIIQKDKNISKIMTLINQEMIRNEFLKQQQKRVRKQFEKVNNNHNKNIAKYHKSIAQNILKPQQKILDLIKEEQVEQSKQLSVHVKNKISNQLFSERDVNKIEQKTKNKNKNQRITLKEKRTNLFKQN